MINVSIISSSGAYFIKPCAIGRVRWGIFHGKERNGNGTLPPEVTNFFTDYIRLYLGLY